jgi:hypothetical protein
MSAAGSLSRGLDDGPDAPSLAELLDPEVLADPYTLYRSLREFDPVLWDPPLHAWVVTSYSGVLEVLHKFSADRTPTPEQLKAMGMGALEPVAQVMVRQMLFMDAPAHTRLRGLCANAFRSRRVETLRTHIQEIADSLIDRALPLGRMDVITDFANPLPAIVTAELMGLPAGDHEQLKAWSADFGEMLGNFQHNPDRVGRVVKSVGEMTSYMRAAVREQALNPHEGLIRLLMDTSVDGTRLDEDEIVANIIVTMVGGQETTTNLIGNGLLTLLRNSAALAQLRDDPTLIESSVEELLRYESPSQHTGRLAPEDTVVCGKTIRKRDAVMAVMAAGNRDPEQVPDPDTLDLARSPNRHLAFGWAAHFCFGAPLARIEAQVAFATLLRRLRGVRLASQPLEWRQNLGLRGLTALPVTFETGSVW